MPRLLRNRPVPFGTIRSEVIGSGCVHVSFDIFDTLVMRPFAEPVDLFGYIEDFSGEIGFKAARIEAEASCRRRLGREVTLDEIYSCLDARFGHLEEAEKETEIGCAVPDPAVCGLLRELADSGREVVLISDMYLPEETVSAILDKCGITGFRLYLSSSLMRTKHDGSLFRHVLEDLGIPASDLIHIGDNPRADMRIPESMGIRSFLYMSDAKGVLRRPDTVRYLSCGEVRERSIVAAVTAMLRTGVFGDASDPWFILGAVYGGPLLYGYGRFVQDLHVPGKRVVFISRDGYGLRKVMERIAPEIDDTAYVHAQRLISYVLTDGSVPFGRTTVPSAVLHKYEHGAVLHRLTCILYFFRKELGIDAVPSDPGEIESLYNSNADRIDGLRRRKLEEYTAYLRRECGDGELELVDCTTMKYTSQRLVESIVGRKVEGRYLVTLRDEDSPDHREYVHKKGPLFGWSRVNINEFFMCSPELPISGWDVDRPRYSDDSPEWEVVRASNYERMCDGMCRFAEVMTDLFGQGLPAFSYKTSEDWVILSAEDADTEDIMYGMYWASGPTHDDWYHLIPRRSDVVHMIAKVGMDIISKMND